MRDRSIFNSDTDPENGSASLACREGILARATGHSACSNPYLGIAVNQVDLSHVQRAEWVDCCHAWWKGWDDEETRRRPLPLARHSPGAAPPLKLSDWPLERAACLAERSAAGSGRDFVTNLI